MATVKGTVTPYGVTNGTVQTGGTVVGSARQLGSGNLGNHAVLLNRNAPDQHSIAAITGLQGILDTKFDDMEVENGYVFLLCNGERVKGPLGPFDTGNGSGGAATYTITITNLLDTRIMTVSEGESVVLKFNYASVDDEGMDDGPGIGQVLVGGVVKQPFSAVQGENEVDITGYLAAGTNNVSIRISNSENASKQLPYTVTVAAVYLASSFDASVPYSGVISFPYTPTGIADKLMHFELDGVVIATQTVTTSGRQQSIDIRPQSHGSHILRVWFTCEINGTTVPSNVLYYSLICTVEGDNTPIIAVVSPPLSGVEQYSNIVKKYRVYHPLSLTAAITLEVDGEVVSSLTVDRTEQTWTYRPETVGQIEQTIRCGETSVSWTQNVTESSIDVEAETEALALYLDSYGRSNNEDDPAVWESEAVSCEFRNFNFVSDGWVQDRDDITVLRVTGDARLHIPYRMFAYDFRTTGKTLEFELATRDVLNYEAEVLSCWNGDRGFKITAQQLRLASEQSGLDTRYKEDEHIRISFVVQKKSEHRLILCYINGIMSGAVRYPEDDDFSQAEPVGITIGSNDCTTDLYVIRAYDNSLTRHQILDNWISDTQKIHDKLARYARNDVYDAYGQVVISKLPNDLCYLVLQCDRLPQFKGDKVKCSGYFVDLIHPERSFSFVDAEIDVQGTSSQYYYVKNIKFKGKSGFILFDGSTVSVYAMNEDAVPVSTFTMKADVASSEGYYNVVTAKLFNRFHPFKMPAQEKDPRTRYSIDGFPIVIFWDNGKETKFLGKYNFNNDKGTPEPFGLVPGDERWEVLQNGTPRVGFHSADFSDDSWMKDFEGNYPDGNTDVTNLQAMCAWVTSTDTDQATGEAIEPVTLGGAEYTADTKGYRLAKFDAELADHFVEDAVAYYYVFTEAFLCMDQREKNVLWRYIKALAKWLADYYDADSIIGFNNQAQPVFDYWMEDIDYTASGDPVYNGQNSTFWRNLRAVRAEDVKAAWHRLRDAGFSYETVIEAFEEHKSKWPEAIYNEDMQRKCLDALELEGDGTYLSFLYGDKWEWTKWFMYNRFRYLDSKYEYGTSVENRATIRTNKLANLSLTYYMKMYGHVYYNAEHVEKRVEKDTEYEFISAAISVEDRVIGINDADMITSLGNLAPHDVELIDLSKMVRLKRLKLGDGAEGYVNYSLTSVTFGNNILLRSVDIRNCAALALAPDVSGCTNIEEILAEGSGITGIKLPAGGILKTLHLPETVVSLQVVNQPQLADFSIPGYSQITTLRLENAGVLSNIGMDILMQMPKNSRVRVLGFDTEMTRSEFSGFINKLEAMRGLDENGNNVELAQVVGNIRVDAISVSDLGRAEKYVGLTLTYDEVISVARSLIQGTFSGVYEDDRATAFTFPISAAGSTFTGLVLPNVTYTGLSDTDRMTKLTVIYMPKLTSHGVYSFLNAADELVELNLNSLAKLDGTRFTSVNKLPRADFRSLTTLGGSVFKSAAVLETLILRSETMCALTSSDPLSTSPIASGTGYIYVPRALVDSYKSATNWSSYATQFRAIEDYPDICAILIFAEVTHNG